ncbi:MAG TPA: NADH-quinone oxidoreductase subunit M [Candidatus Bathyarchaeia archaeon]|nr:NADH-quinone oxidoreductase subunit M [Candidatus Bathyarchaeia archaeon]
MLGLLTLIIFLPVVMAIPTLLLGKKRTGIAKIIGIGTTVVVFLISIVIVALFQYGSPGFQFTDTASWASTFGLDYIVGIDGISLPLLIIATFLCLLAAAGSRDLISLREPEYYALFLLFETGIIGVFTSLNLILFYVFWEVVLIPMFFFIGIWGGPRRKYASLKFLIFTYAGSAIMLFGFVAVYAWTGATGSPSFDYTVLITRTVSLAMPLQVVASLATFVGFAVKLPIFPLHTWLPDAHVEAPAPVSVLLAGLLLKMGGYGLIRYNLLMFPAADKFLWPAYTAIGLITMIYGASVAFVAQDLKRMIAMTSVNHMGYVLLGTFTLGSLGVSAAVFQMFAHGLAVGMLFLMSGYIHEHTGTRNINELRGLRGKMPTTTALLIFGSMAAMAVPGFANFISEYQIIQGALSVTYLYGLAILAPALTVGYFLWMLRRVAMTPPIGPKNELSTRPLLILTAFLVPLLVFGVYPLPLLASAIRPTVDHALSVLFPGGS